VIDLQITPVKIEAAENLEKKIRAFQKQNADVARNSPGHPRRVGHWRVALYVELPAQV
jgi:hypothetical protein